MTIRYILHPAFNAYLTSISSNQNRVHDITSIINSINSDIYTVQHLTDGFRISTPPYPFSWVANKNHDKIYFRPPLGSPLFSLKVTSVGSYYDGHYILCYYESMYSDEIFLVSVLTQQQLHRLKKSLKPNQMTLCEAKSLIAKYALLVKEYFSKKNPNQSASTIRDLQQEIQKICLKFRINSNPNAPPPLFEVDKNELIDPPIDPSIKVQWDDLQEKIDSTYNELLWFRKQKDYLNRIDELFELFEKHESLQSSQRALKHPQGFSSVEIPHQKKPRLLNEKMKLREKQSFMRRLSIPDSDSNMRKLNAQILVTQKELENIDDLERVKKEQEVLEKVTAAGKGEKGRERL